MTVGVSAHLQATTLEAAIEFRHRRCRALEERFEFSVPTFREAAAKALAAPG